MYKINNSGDVVRVADNAVLPSDPSNADYAAYLAWCEEGNIAVLDVEPSWRERVWADYRGRRETYLDRLAGIATFDDDGDGVVRGGCKLFRQRLLDLPAHPDVAPEVTPDRAALELGIVTLYRSAVDEATAIAPAARVAFSKISH